MKISVTYMESCVAENKLIVHGQVSTFSIRNCTAIQNIACTSSLTGEDTVRINLYFRESS